MKVVVKKWATASRCAFRHLSASPMRTAMMRWRLVPRAGGSSGEATRLRARSRTWKCGRATRSAMKRRTAANCRSTLPCASSKCRVIPRIFASASMSAVNAVRQSLSAPTWENPTVSADAGVTAVTQESSAADIKLTNQVIRDHPCGCARFSEPPGKQKPHATLPAKF
jgi:hypothetical protein